MAPAPLAIRPSREAEATARTADPVARSADERGGVVPRRAARDALALLLRKSLAARADPVAHCGPLADVRAVDDLDEARGRLASFIKSGSGGRPRRRRIRRRFGRRGFAALGCAAAAFHGRRRPRRRGVRNRRRRVQPWRWRIQPWRWRSRRQRKKVQIRRRRRRPRLRRQAVEHRPCLDWRWIRLSRWEIERRDVLLRSGPSVGWRLSDGLQSVSARRIEVQDRLLGARLPRPMLGLRRRRWLALLHVGGGACLEGHVRRRGRRTSRWRRFGSRLARFDGRLVSVALVFVEDRVFVGFEPPVRPRIYDHAHAATVTSAVAMVEELEAPAARALVPRSESAPREFDWQLAILTEDAVARWARGAARLGRQTPPQLDELVGGLMSADATGPHLAVRTEATGRFEPLLFGRRHALRRAALQHGAQDTLETAHRRSGKAQGDPRKGPTLALPSGGPPMAY